MGLSEKSLRIEAKRRRRARSKRNPFDLRAVRLRDLNRLFDHRFGGSLPNTDDGRRAALVMVNHLAMLPMDPQRRVLDWLKAAAPWYTLADLNEIIVDVLPNPKRYKAATLAFLFKVTAAEREAIGLITIGAIGQTAAGRRQTSAKLRMQKLRRKKGMRHRASYLAQAKKPKPWLAEGISRAQWYRRRKLARSLPISE